MQYALCCGQAVPPPAPHRTAAKTGNKKETVQIDSLAPNPFIRHIYTADPSAHVWADGRLYVYASHDIDPPRGCDPDGPVSCVFHRRHGALDRPRRDSPRLASALGTQGGRLQWAPDCAYKDGTYYFYFPHPSGTYTNDSWKIGVATSKEPAANFTVQGYIEGLDPIIDPCVFVDDDGQAYLYQGGGGTCKGGRLKDNMMEIDGAMQTMEGLVDFHEATWVHKYNGKYYLSYSDNHNPGQEGVEGYNRMRYAVSDHPLGPWKYMGIYMGGSDCFTNHGSIVEYKGEWFAFYHSIALSGNPALRSVCVDRLYYNPDGTIRMVERRK